MPFETKFVISYQEIQIHNIMATFKPSKYQRLVYQFIKSCKGNAVVEAVAGSGKSTTIVNAISIIPENKQILFLAFNKSIVMELEKKIGNKSNCDIKTLHSLGAKQMMYYYHSQIEDTKYKAYFNQGIESGLFHMSGQVPEDATTKEDWKRNIMQLVDLGRVNLCNSVKELDDIAYKFQLYIVDNECDVAWRIIQWGKAHTEIIDFTDMIYLPVVLNVRMWQYDWVFIDECQDLNAAQRELFLRCIKKGGRFIAVGDRMQSIYGFSGADEESFNKLKSLPRTAKLPLSICYRCDKKIIEIAKQYVPQIEARDNAEDGVVDYDSKVADVQDGDMVLCRVTAPLVRLCVQYIASGVKAYVKGRDIGINLINMIKKTRKKNIADCYAYFDKELKKIDERVMKKTHCNAKEAAESEMHKTYEDKVQAIQILSEGLTTTAAVMNHIEEIFKDENGQGICLSTIHKSKGLESDRVFVLCEEKLFLKSAMRVAWQAQQEYNLCYVLTTRAKHFLGYIRDFKM